MEATHYAVYILNGRRNYVITTKPTTDREAAARSDAAKRKNAIIVPGLLSEFPPKMTPEEAAERTKLAVPGLAPVATD